MAPRSLLGYLALAGLFSILPRPAGGQPIPTSVAPDPATGVEWVTVTPEEFPGAINNPLKGFRDYHPDGYGLLVRRYIPWNQIEHAADDPVDRIIAHTNTICRIGPRGFEELNVKLIPRVYLDWDGSEGTPEDPRQHWPADLATFDYDSPAFQARLAALIAKLGQAWDDDPRIAAVQMGLIGRWGEHHNPAPTAAQRRLLADAFRRAFKHKPVLVRHTDEEFMAAGFGIYYDTFAYLPREPPGGARDQFPWQATHVYPHIWRRAPIEGEVEYNWQRDRAEADPDRTFGRSPDETLATPAFRRYMIDKIRRYHVSYLGWISDHNSRDPAVLEGAAALQKAFGYRFVIDSFSYPLAPAPGAELTVRLTLRNTGSAPFYLDWPVAVALLDPETLSPAWSAPLEGIDIRSWLPGQGWDSETSAYRRPAPTHANTGTARLPEDLPPGEYLIALAILDRAGGLVPSARFAIKNYLRGGWHPLGFIGIGAPPRDAALEGLEFASPAFDDSLSYRVPAHLLAVRQPPVPEVEALPKWSPVPEEELINPWRYWTLEASSGDVEKQVSTDGPVEDAAGRRVITVVGEFGDASYLSYSFPPGHQLPAGRYRFQCHVRGTPGLSVRLQICDGWRPLTEPPAWQLAQGWVEHVAEFTIGEPFSSEPRLRLRLPPGQSGELHLTGARLKKVE